MVSSSTITYEKTFPTSTTEILISKGVQLPYEKEIIISSYDYKDQMRLKYIMIPIYQVLDEEKKNKIYDITIKNPGCNMFKQNTLLAKIKFTFKSNSILYSIQDFNGKSSVDLNNIIY